MKQIIHILKFKLLIFIRADSKITWQYFLKNIASGLIYTGFAIGAFLFSINVIKFLLGNIKIGLFLLHQFISMILFIFFISVNVGNIIVSYSTLYKSAEVNFLLTKPVVSTKIFFIKFLDNFFYSSSTLLLILFAFLAGYSFYFHLGVAEFFLILFNFIPFMFSAGSLGVIILLIVLRVSHKFSFRKVIIFLSGLYLLSIGLFFKANSPKLMVESLQQYNPLLNRDLYLTQLLPAKTKFLPNSWLSETGYWIVRGDISTSLALTFLQIVLSLLLFSIALYLGKRWYFKTWLLNIKIVADRFSKRKESKSFFAKGNNLFFNFRSEAIIKRDILLFLRETSQVFHFTILIILIIIFMISVSGIKYIGIGNFYLQTMIYLTIFLFTLLLVSTLSLRFIFPLLSLEGPAFWKIRSAPIDVKSYLINKILPFGSLILLISIALSYFSNSIFRGDLTFFSVWISIVASLTMIAINFGMGGAFANYKEKNAIRISSSQGATISFLLNIIYMIMLIVFLFKPLSELFLSITIKKYFNREILLNQIMIITFLSFVIIIFFLKIAKDSIQKDFQ